MTTVLLRADGPYSPGFNPPTATGTTPIGDNTDATWLDFPQGSGNATVGLATPGPGETVEAPIWLHLRLQVFAASPPTMTGEVFLNTAGDGSAATEFAGFSDGTGSGFAFVVPSAAYDGVVELAVPLALTAWPGSTVADVVAALESGCFLDFNAWTWVSGDSPPTVRVFEAWVQAGAEVLSAPKLRLYPRDDTLGFGGVARQYPPPRRGRLYGQQP